MKVAVIGAGVIGLSTARGLAVAGADVDIFEAATPGAGTTGTSYAWVSSNAKWPLPYYELNLAGIREHERLQAQAQGARWFEQSGTYEWHVGAEEEKFRDRLKWIDESGYKYQQISMRDLQERLDYVRVDPRSSIAAFFPDEGYVYPSILLAWLWSDARAHGARLSISTEVMSITEQAAGVQLELSNGQSWTGDFAVSAVGRWTVDLAARTGIQFASFAQLQKTDILCSFLGFTKPMMTLLDVLLITPELNVRPDGGGRLIAQVHDYDTAADPTISYDPAGALAQEFAQRLRRLFYQPTPVEFSELRVGQRSQTADGKSAVGFLTDSRRLYMIVTHSGITMGPLLGRLAAEEMSTGERPKLLGPYSPDRLTGQSVLDFPAFARRGKPSDQ